MSTSHSDIPEKANRILNLVLLMLVLIALRIWYLTVIQYDAKLEESRRPQNRTVVEPARRATIRDRFDLPLAINKMQYRVAIQYSQFKQVPAAVWTTVNGKKVKQSRRREYISALSQLLADELELDPERLEDLIVSKAALYYHLPFVIKEEISEKQYYRLKMLEKDWLGISVQRVPRRTYPMGKVGADIVGYMGAINQSEYEKIIGEMKALDKYLKAKEAGEDPPMPAYIKDPEKAQGRLIELQELAYTFNDYVGKAGIEGRFDASLRGFRGKKKYYADARGNFLRELPGTRGPIPGTKFVLSISAELQEFAEELLIKNERIREAQISNPDGPQKSAEKQPWIKGGAVVAIDPNNGEILALASYPRFDPNDFIASGDSERNAQKQANVLRWLENESYLGQIWDMKRPLERERYLDDEGCCEDDTVWLTWEQFIKIILPSDSSVKNAMERFGTVQEAVDLQNAAELLLEASGQNNGYWLMNVLYEDHKVHGTKMPASIRQAIEENLDQQEEQVAQCKKTLDRFCSGLEHHYDKVLLIDLCRLAVNGPQFSESLLQIVGHQNLEDHRKTCAAKAVVEPVVKSLSKTLFHENQFKLWRQQDGKEFIQQKRKEEKQLKRYTKPYIDYLDEKEKGLFQQFWKENSSALISAFLLGSNVEGELSPYLSHFNDWFREIANGAHSEVSWRSAYNTLQTALKDLPKELGVQYLQTLRSFNELTRPLFGRYQSLRKKNGIQLEKHLAMGFYPLNGYGYGRSHAYRQAATQGSIFKLVTAYAAMAQRCRELGLEPTSQMINPLTIVDMAQKKGKKTTVGFHEDGTPIPQLYKGGRIPKSIMRSIGELDVTRAIEVSSNPYFILLAGDVLHDPNDLLEAAKTLSYGSRTGIDLPGEISGRFPTDLATNRTGLYSTAIGQHSLVVTPLQTSVMLAAVANGGKVVKPQIVHRLTGIHRNEVDEKSDRPVFMPNVLRDTLLSGMQRVVQKMYEGGLGNLSRLYRDYPEAISDYLDLKGQFVGKTSTAESMERIDLDRLHGANKYTHLWFGSIAFDQSEEAYLARDRWGRPELVVVVYLRYGKYGKDSAPPAAQVVKKWRDIKAKQEKGPKGQRT